MGLAAAEVETLFGLGRRQRQRLERLVDMPDRLQQAVHEERVSATHALRLMAHVRQHPTVDPDAWLDWIEAEHPSLRDLAAALRRSGPSNAPASRRYDEERTKHGTRIRLHPVTLHEGLDEEARRAAIAQLQALIERLRPR